MVTIFEAKSVVFFSVDTESGRCSWHHVPNLNFHLKRLNNGLQENGSEADSTDDETASPRGRRRRNRRLAYYLFLQGLNFRSICSIQ